MWKDFGDLPATETGSDDIDPPTCASSNGAAPGSRPCMQVSTSRPRTSCTTFASRAVGKLTEGHTGILRRLSALS